MSFNNLSFGLRGPFLAPRFVAPFERQMPLVNFLFVFKAKRIPYRLAVKSLDKVFRNFYRPQWPLLYERNYLVANLLW